MPSIPEGALTDPDYWRDRAKELRDQAGATPHKEETRLLLELAEMHEKFAADIQARQNSNRDTSA
jgi:hypothetical protein